MVATAGWVRATARGVSAIVRGGLIVGVNSDITG